MESDNRNHIVIISPGDSFFTDPFKRAFEKWGFECALFNHRQGAVFTNRTLRLIIRHFPFLRFLKTSRVRKTNRALVRLVREFRPKYLFAQKGESIYPETIEEINKLGVVTIGLFNDMMDHWNVISKIAPAYNYFFTVDGVVLKKLRDELGLKNCFYMALATEPMADPFTDRQNKYDISFIGQPGSGHSDREKLLKSISDLGLNIWGTVGWVNTPLAPLFRGHSEGTRRLDIYGHSKIVLDTTWDLMPTDFVSNRAFEAMGCGAMFMTNGTGNTMRDAYIDGKEVVLFRDDHELREKVIYYLAHSTEREAIARAGYARTVAEHTYDARMKQMLDTIENPVPT